MTIIKSKFFKNFIILTLSTLIINVVEMLTNIYITNKIGTTVLGSYSLIMNLFNFLVTISLFGIPLAITKIVSESDILKNNSNIACSSKIACKFCAIISICVCIFTILFKNELVSILLNDIVDSNVIIILALSLPFIALTSCFCGYFNALRKVNEPVISEFLMHIVKSFFIVTLLYINFPTYECLTLGIFLSEFTSFIYSFILYKKDVKSYQIKKNENKVKIIKNIFRISAPISFTSFIRSGLSTLKHTLIPIRLQTYGYSYEYALSRYGIIHGIALPFILMPSIFINSFASLILPEYSRYFASNNVEKIKTITQKIFKITILASLYISFVIYISADIICFKLYNNHEVAYYVKILTPIICIMYLDSIVDSMLKGLDLQVSVMKINIIDLLLSITLIYFGIPFLGTFGYILVLYTSEYINGVMSIEKILKKANIKFRYLEWVIKPLICLFTAFFIINLLPFKIVNFSTLLLALIIFSVIFIFLTTLMNLIPKVK